MRAINLKTNHLTEPVGIDEGALFLSWKCADGVRQTAYEIELTANGETVWHSGKVQSTAQSRIRSHCVVQCLNAQFRLHVCTHRSLSCSF